MPGDLWARIHKDRFFCKKSCIFRNGCGFLANLAKQNEADVLIANHHLTFFSVKRNTKVLDDIGLLVIDEAHEAEDVATAAFSTTVSSKDLLGILGELIPEKGHDLLKLVKDASLEQYIIDKIDEIRDLTEEIHERFGVDTSYFSQDNINAVQRMQVPLTDLTEALDNTLVDELRAFSGQIGEVNAHLDDILMREFEEEHIYWKTSNQKHWKIMATPVYAAWPFKENLYKKDKITIFLSATLSTNGDISFFKSRVGLNEDCPELIVSSPYNYKEQVMLYVPLKFPDPTSESYMDALLKESVSLINIFKGRTLILFTSLSAMKEFREKVEERLPHINWLVQGEEPTPHLVEKFKTTPYSVLLGTKSFWQGVDVEGDALQCVIIARLPFVVPDDPVSLARQQKFEDQGLNPFTHYQVPNAIILFKQGFGRLIRSKTDKGVVAIFDARVKTKKYGKMFLDALPECTVTNSLYQIKLKFGEVEGSTEEEEEISALC